VAGIPIAIFGKYGVRRGSRPYRLAYDIGFALADAGFTVANGGYAGTMEAASKGAKDAGGNTIGVTCPSVLEKRWRRTSNPFLDEVHPAPNIMARIEQLIRLCGGYVVLPGGTGTLAELAVALEFVDKKLIKPRPIVLVGDWWEPVIDLVRGETRSGLTSVVRSDDPADVARIMRAHAVKPNP